MKIEKNKVVVLSYTLKVDGTICDRADESAPLDYIHGTGMLLPKFEEATDGLEEGGTFEFSLTPEEGYGEWDESKRFDIPKTSFVVDGVLREDLLKVGKVIPMLNGAGEVCQAQIAEVKMNDVTVDFNHPLAGKQLDFSGKIISVRDATEKELKEGLHGEYLPPEEGHHCCHHGKGGCCGKHKHEGEGCCHGEGGCHHDEE